MSPDVTIEIMAETEKRYTHAYGQLRRLTSTIDCQTRQMSVSGIKAMQILLHGKEFTDLNVRGKEGSRVAEISQEAISRVG